MNFSSGLSDSELTALSSVYVSCLTLSLVGSSSVFIASIVKRKNLNDQAKPLIQLALADLLASVCLFLTSVMSLLSPGALRSSALVCSAGLALSLTFYYVSFLLVIVYAFESAHSIQGWREEDEGVTQQDSSRRKMRRRMMDLLYVLVWLFPVVGFVIYIRTVSFSLLPLHQNFKYEQNAWPNTHFCSSCILFLHLHIDDPEVCSTVDLRHTKYIKTFTFAIVLFGLICCTLMYWRLEVRQRRYDRASVRRAQAIWSSARYMILVIVICWTPAMALIGLSFVWSESERLFPLFIIQAVSVSLHGFLNSIVYAWRRRNFRDAVLGERTHLLAYTRHAFFDQSLRLNSEE